MKRRRRSGGLRGIARELCTIGRRGRQVWRLVPWRHRLALGAALAVMSLASAANVAIALGLGQVIDAVNQGARLGQRRDVLMGVAALYLSVIGGAYLVRE